MMKQLFFLIGCIAAVNCNCQTKSFDYTAEVEKWKTELLLNGEVGPPCTEPYQKWIEKNPNYYFGLQKIESKMFDFNSDGIKDGLFYFPAVNCVGGNGIGSDFAILIYSHQNKVLTNKNITGTIESKIGIALNDIGFHEHSPIHVNYKAFEKTIKGEYMAWTNSDAHVGGSINGTFEYNPVNFSLKIKNQQEIEK